MLLKNLRFRFSRLFENLRFFSTYWKSLTPSHYIATPDNGGEDSGQISVAFVVAIVAGSITKYKGLLSKIIVQGKMFLKESPPLLVLLFGLVWTTFFGWLSGFQGNELAKNFPLCSSYRMNFNCLCLNFQLRRFCSRLDFVHTLLTNILFITFCFTWLQSSGGLRIGTQKDCTTRCMVVTTDFPTRWIALCCLWCISGVW